ncbi:MAG: class I SAM-dependent methyltransferase [Bacteroidota bacterium]|nr:class I SAM-dependent methyltransferase [Bacteroidota bacterium]MEC8238985.1 class I SAM-dependent methyltransferase [Bacteroidota bacterium]
MVAKVVNLYANNRILLPTFAHMHNKEWFASWFESSYYHSLYAHRDHQEAASFVAQLIDLIQPKNDATILDVACGRGRHSLEIHRHGYKVTGIDLSPKNIEYAQKTAQREGIDENVQFMVQDMREPLDKQFSHLLNLFTSFGYFKDPNDNVRTLNAFRAQLAPNGVGVIDYLNPKWVLSNLIESEKLIRDDIEFSIQRQQKGKWLQKDIRFQVNAQDFHFQEEVELLEVKDFIALFAKANLQLVDLFGDYQLGTFDSEKSSRQILIFQ